MIENIDVMKQTKSLKSTLAWITDESNPQKIRKKELDKVEKEKIGPLQRYSNHPGIASVLQK